MFQGAAMRTTYLVPITILALLSTVAGAPEQVVRQKGRAFSVVSMTVARGQPVVFLNDDTVPHNVMSSTLENAFDLGRRCRVARPQ
jgi:plastocyanin